MYPQSNPQFISILSQLTQSKALDKFELMIQIGVLTANNLSTTKFDWTADCETYETKQSPLLDLFWLLP